MLPTLATRTNVSLLRESYSCVRCCFFWYKTTIQFSITQNPEEAFYLAYRNIQKQATGISNLFFVAVLHMLFLVIAQTGIRFSD